MLLNQMSVRIPEGCEKTSGYIEISHGQQYTIVMRNRRSVRADAELTVDGKLIGTFRINANETIRLERPLDDDGRFTFYRLNSDEAEQAELDKVSNEDLGLIAVTFKPEKHYIRPITPWVDPNPYIPPWTRPWPYVDPWRDTTTTWANSDGNTGEITYTNDSLRRSPTIFCCVADAAISTKVGGTGLSGRSDQAFYQVTELDYDLSQETTIYLRLVEKKDQPNIRPLKPVMRSNPIPPPVG